MIGFLHTSPVHVPVFENLVAGRAPTRHLVDESLLAAARTGQPIEKRLLAQLRTLFTASIIVCTCSTLGPAAAALSAQVGVPVLRVDEPMARAAVAAGRRIGVVVAVASTLEPTMTLLGSVARPTTLLVPAPCYEAWSLFEAGDLTGYAHRLAGHARDLDVDVVVLAQASMAPAAELLADLEKPVLTSPRAAVEHALDRCAEPISGRDAHRPAIPPAATRL